MLDLPPGTTSLGFDGMFGVHRTLEKGVDVRTTRACAKKKNHSEMTGAAFAPHHAKQRTPSEQPFLIIQPGGYSSWIAGKVTVKSWQALR